MKKHTTGPWKVGPGIGSSSVLTGDDDLVAKAWTCADADLIAAAPELLEALETSVRWLRRLEAEFPGCLNDDAITKHLEPAITKAKGGK